MDDNFSATGHDMSRPGTTDNDFTLSLEDAAQLYARAGHPRTLRSLQRYCVNGHLDASKIQTTLGDKYLVTPQSVARHIAQIEELSALDNVASGRAFSRHVATDSDTPADIQNDVISDATVDDNPATDADMHAATPPKAGDTSRHVPTDRDTPRQSLHDADIYEHPYVRRLEQEIARNETRYERLELKYDAQVKETQSILVRANEAMIELQKASQVAQSKTLAEYLLRAKEFLLGANAAEQPNTQ